MVGFSHGEDYTYHHRSGDLGGVGIWLEFSSGIVILSILIIEEINWEIQTRENRILTKCKDKDNKRVKGKTKRITFYN